METSVQIRFRHSNGDVGPFTFQDSATVESVKEKLFAEWPKGSNSQCTGNDTLLVCSRQALILSFFLAEGSLAQESPTQAADIKLILSGKWCEGSKFLKGADERSCDE